MITTDHIPSGYEPLKFVLVSGMSKDKRVKYIYLSITHIDADSESAKYLVYVESILKKACKLFSEATFDYNSL